MNLSIPEQQKYFENPLNDEWLRSLKNIPDNKYYTISVYPIPGKLTIIKDSHREVKNKKISKSNQ